MSATPRPGTPTSPRATLARPRKRVAADVILRDQDGRLLLVNPTYEPDWDLPGGMVEENEAPIDAASRELREELGLDVPIGPLLCVEWVPPHGPWDDTLVFIFDGGVLTPETIQTLAITDEEISAFRFCTSDETRELLRPYVWQRSVAAFDALETGHAQYRHRQDEST